ncbi:MAG: ATP-binding protein [Desulfobacterales bacterium]|nr:ATP-binding protein [Desulfobacterales bacterium]
MKTLQPVTKISTQELSLIAGFPEKSVHGLTVTKSASFGRQVTLQDYRKMEPTNFFETRPAIQIGKVFHMGSAEHIDINLDIQSLSMHTLITGTTGSGKTNCTFTILKKIHELENPIPFLVIEPVKGEYEELVYLLKSSKRSVRYLTAGIPHSEVLKINPFAFPNGVHVFEHIDRLVQVFNAAFPMYAAMPALLEQGIIQSYKASGWNLNTSQCMHSPFRFPTLFTLIKQLKNVIETAGYSSKLTEDYKGALITRIQSLTRGIRGEILCPLPNEATQNDVLFDHDCIINLKSIGSPETKSLIMGFLFLKLYEYRQCAMNDMSYSEKVRENKLLHLTVIEEAHNLLKRHNTEMSQDSANLRGMGIEMFANAIAEIRAMGEGFLIVDQSPTSLDLSVIKNTNTKIALRTPFKDDRELMGASINANDQQVTELGLLQTGVGAIYQNDWIEPLLCLFDRCEIKNITRPISIEKKLSLTHNQIYLVFYLPSLLQNYSADIMTALVKEKGFVSLEECLTYVVNIVNIKDITPLRQMYSHAERERLVGYRKLCNLFHHGPKEEKSYVKTILSYLSDMLGEFDINPLVIKALKERKNPKDKDLLSEIKACFG